MLVIDQRGAIDAIPEMLGQDPAGAADMQHKLGRMIEVLGLKTSDAQQRYKQMRSIFEQVQGAHGHAEMPTADASTVHALPGRKGHGPRRHV